MNLESGLRRSRCGRCSPRNAARLGTRSSPSRGFNTSTSTARSAGVLSPSSVPTSPRLSNQRGECSSPALPAASRLVHHHRHLAEFAACGTYSHGKIAAQLPGQLAMQVDHPAVSRPRATRPRCRRPRPHQEGTPGSLQNAVYGRLFGQTGSATVEDRGDHLIVGSIRSSATTSAHRAVVWRPDPRSRRRGDAARRRGIRIGFSSSMLIRKPSEIRRRSAAVDGRSARTMRYPGGSTRRATPCTVQKASPSATTRLLAPGRPGGTRRRSCPRPPPRPGPDPVRRRRAPGLRSTVPPPTRPVPGCGHHRGPPCRVSGQVASCSSTVR